MDPQDESQVDDISPETNPPGPDDSSTPAVEEPPADDTPDWQFILDATPESLRGVLQPEIEKYAQVQRSRYEEVENKYKSQLEPWNDVIQFEPTAVQQAIQFVQWMDSDPTAAINSVIDTLRKEGRWTDEPAPGTVPAVEPETPPVEDDDLDLDDPVIQKLFNKFQGELGGVKEILTRLAEKDEQAEKARQAQEQEKQVNEFLNGLKEKFEHFDKDFVISQMARGVPGEQAAKAYNDRILEAAKKLVAPAEDAPPVLGGGSPPSNKVSPGKMTPEQRAAYVADRLRQDAEAARQ